MPLPSLEHITDEELFNAYSRIKKNNPGAVREVDRIMQEEGYDGPGAWKKPLYDLMKKEPYPGHKSQMNPVIKYAGVAAAALLTAGYIIL